MCLAVSSISISQESNDLQKLDSVMLDTKTPIARKNSGKVVVEITQEMLQRNAGESVATVLNQVSGIEINGSRSNAGQNLGYYVRGGRNRQVVIMIDGVQLNDPSQISNDYDLRLIPANNIEKIEIVKGASSVLYGSGAATAVINITTKKAGGKPFALNLESSIGTNRSQEDDGNYDVEEFTNIISANGTLDKFFYKTDFGNRKVDGLSSIAAPEGEERFDADVFNRYNGRVNLGYNFSDNVSFSQFFSFDKFKADFDNFDFTDAENQSITSQLKTGGHYVQKYAKGMYVFNDNFSWIERDIESDFPSKYNARAYTLDNYITYNFSTKLTGLIGLNYNRSDFESFSVPFGEEDFQQDINMDEAKFNIIDPYANVTYFTDFGLNLSAGVPVNIHSKYNTNLVYNVNPSYNFSFGESNLKVLGSYSTAYITPSLFQLYAPSFGNEELSPEEDRTIEGGLEFTTDNKFRISAVYFDRNEKDFIDFVTIDPTTFESQYRNIDGDFNSYGVEVELSKRFGEKVNINANYTNTQADERFALRIPEHKLNATIGFKASERLNLSTSFQYNSERTDVFFDSTTFANENVTLDSYSIVDFNLRMKLTDFLSIFGTVNNILNTEYEELYRFQTKGRNVRIGFNVNI